LRSLGKVGRQDRRPSAEARTNDMGARAVAARRSADGREDGSEADGEPKFDDGELDSEGTCSVVELSASTEGFSVSLVGKLACVLPVNQRIRFGVTTNIPRRQRQIDPREVRMLHRGSGFVGANRHESRRIVEGNGSEMGYLEQGQVERGGHTIGHRHVSE